MKQYYLRQEIHLRQALEQKLMLTQNMQMAIQALSLPVQELAEWIQERVEENPALEFLEKREVHAPLSFDSEVAAEISLYDHLMEQARERIPEALDMAAMIIGNLNEKGFLDVPLEELGQKERLLDILSIIQTFEPIGIAARDVRESLILQLKQKNSRYGLELVEKYYQDMLHGRLSVLAKKMKLTPKGIQSIIEKEIRPLDPFPGLKFSHSFAKPVHRDLIIEHNGMSWMVRHPSELYPSFKVNPFALSKYIAEGKWLIEVLYRRKRILEDVAQEIIRVQEDYLLEKTTTLSPLTLRETAAKLQLSESTLSRALKDKYAETPRGFVPLRHFFCSSVISEESISQQKAKEVLKELILQEKKSRPLPDELLAKLMEQKGIPISRRTIAKYRKEMGISSSFARNSTV